MSTFYVRFVTRSGREDARKVKAVSQIQARKKVETRLHPRMVLKVEQVAR